MARRRGYVSTGKPGTVSECPEDKIREIQEEHPEICVMLQKRDMKGHLANLSQRFCPITDLLDGTLVDNLRDETGGGTYRIDPRDAITRQVHIVPPYVVTISGPAKAVGSVVDATARPAVRPVHAVPTYAQQAQAERAAAIDPNTVWARSPDEIASEVADDYRNQAAALRAEMRTYADKAARTIDTLKQQLDAEKRDKEKKEHESQLQLLRQELRAIAEKPVAVAKPTLDGTAIVGLVTAAGTILTAILSSGAERQRVAVERQAQAEERRRAAEQQQFQLILGLMKKDDKGNNGAVDILKVLAPVLAPLLPKLLEGRDPTKAAELLSSMAENQMSMLSMVATSMQSMMGEPENPMIAMLRDTVGGVIAAASKASEIAQSQNPANRPTPGIPANRPMAAQATQPQPEPATEVVAAAPTNTQPATVATPPKNGRPLTAPQYAAMLMQHPEWPDDMKHPEWKSILIEMHGTAPAESTGVAVAHKLQAMFQRGVLREDIAAVFTDNSDQPRSVFLRHIFDTFPVAQDNPERYAGILRGIDGEISEEEEVETDEPEVAPIDA